MYSISTQSIGGSEIAGEVKEWMAWQWAFAPAIFRSLCKPSTKPISPNDPVNSGV